MSSVRNTALLSSSEKKRLRDRRAQQTLREKRQNRMLELEARVAFCERNHSFATAAESSVCNQDISPTGPSQGGSLEKLDVAKLLKTVENLRLENSRLRARQESLRQLVGSWNLDDEHRVTEQSSHGQAIDGLHPRSLDCALSEVAHTMSSSPAIDANSSPVTVDTMNNIESAQEMAFADATPRKSMSQYSASICDVFSILPSPHPIVHLPSPPATSATIPPWCRVPRNTYETNNTRVFPLVAYSWFAHPELITACPLKPSPLDLLYGTRRNYLANYIHDRIRKHALRDAEGLAFGYLMYNYSKWRVSLTPSTFALLAPFQHPTSTQLEQDHFSGIDMIIWPQMRLNMIQYAGEIDFMELFDFLACCMKVRWPWNKALLERDSDDNLQVREDFKQVFTREDGWGLTAEFIDRYPMLLAGMDVEALRFEITFPTEMYSY